MKLNEKDLIRIKEELSSEKPDPELLNFLCLIPYFAIMERKGFEHSESDLLSILTATRMVLDQNTKIDNSFNFAKHYVSKVIDLGNIDILTKILDSYAKSKHISFSDIYFDKSFEYFKKYVFPNTFSENVYYKRHINNNFQSNLSLHTTLKLLPFFENSVFDLMSCDPKSFTIYFASLYVVKENNAEDQALKNLTFDKLMNDKAVSSFLKKNLETDGIIISDGRNSIDVSIYNEFCIYVFSALSEDKEFYNKILNLASEDSEYAKRLSKNCPKIFEQVVSHNIPAFKNYFNKTKKRGDISARSATAKVIAANRFRFSEAEFDNIADQVLKNEVDTVRYDFLNYIDRDAPSEYLNVDVGNFNVEDFESDGKKFSVKRVSSKTDIIRMKLSGLIPKLPKSKASDTMLSWAISYGDKATLLKLMGFDLTSEMMNRINKKISSM